jgi:hypothetical protein
MILIFRRAPAADKKRERWQRLLLSLSLPALAVFFFFWKKRERKIGLLRERFAAVGLKRTGRNYRGLLRTSFVFLCESESIQVQEKSELARSLAPLTFSFDAFLSFSLSLSTQKAQP